MDTRPFPLKIRQSTITLCVSLLIGCVAMAQTNDASRSAKPERSEIRSFALDSLQGLEIKSVSETNSKPVTPKVALTTYNGRRALRIITDDSTAGPNGITGGQSLAIVNGVDFKDGTIEVDLVGMPREGSNSESRGFVGIAFRVQGNAEKFENIYLRFTNGRSGDQLRRNHSTQYTSFPDFPWARLRQEHPGVYESYVDIEEKTWTNIKVIVSGSKAQLYVNGASQSCLLVDDLKLGESHGGVALWTGSDTESYFSNLRIK